jgi:hypothetical protein
MASAKKTLSRIQRCACLGITRAICTTPIGAVEALTGLPPLDLVMQCEARSAAHRLWSLGCWSYLHPNRGHTSILTRLQKSDPIFNMGVDVLRPVFNLEPKYRVAVVTREECTRGPGTPPAVKGPGHTERRLPWRAAICACGGKAFELHYIRLHQPHQTEGGLTRRTSLDRSGQWSVVLWRQIFQAGSREWRKNSLKN